MKRAIWLTIVCAGLVIAVPLSAQEPVLQTTLAGHTDEVYAVVFSPDSKILASGSGDKTIKLWDVASGKNSVTLVGHAKHLASLAFNPDGKTLASGSLDGTIKLWDVATGKNAATYDGHSCGVMSVVFSPDGKTLASGAWNGPIGGKMGQNYFRK